jgi:hypothetical protein
VTRSRLSGGVVVLVAGAAVVAVLLRLACQREVSVERRDVEPARSRFELFQDDEVAAKTPPFEAALVDSRPFGEPGNLWQVNASAAVIRLDIRDIEDEPELLELRRSYADAVRDLRPEATLLPSLNLLDGKAKQFDDGLYSALDTHVASGRTALPDLPALLRSLLDQLPEEGEAAAWVRGGLAVGGVEVEAGKPLSSAAAAFVHGFDADPIASRPTGFYTWSDRLQRTFRMLRYFQKGWTRREGAPSEIAAVLADHPETSSRYERLLDFYAHLANPFDALTFADLAEPATARKPLDVLWAERGLAPKPDGPTVHLLPYSHARDTALFNELYGPRLPDGAELMLELVKAIRDGRLDLAPRPESGWRDYQLFALETFLLPERGVESEKLVLTRRYKERLLQAFEALVTKRRETHARQDSMAGGLLSAPPPTTHLVPRLRVEPNPTFYLRTARAYAFLQAYLESVAPASLWRELVGLKETGRRSLPLADELDWMRRFFYGLHLVSCEDIGMRPGLLDGELADAAASQSLAEAWLSTWPEDADLDVDVRVCTPIFVDRVAGVTQHWCNLGLRAAKLQLAYARPPSWRPEPRQGAEPGNWQVVSQLDEATYVILVDEFAEVTHHALDVITREQLREIADRAKRKDAMIAALER